MTTIEEARAAKQKIKSFLEERNIEASFGIIGIDGRDGYAVKINLKQDLFKGFPDLNGVKLLVEVMEEREE